MANRLNSSLQSLFDLGELGVRKKYQGQLQPSARVDLYRFTVSQFKSYQIKLKGLSADADLTLLSSTGAVLNRSKNRGTRSEQLTGTLEPGTYRLRVILKSGEETNYRLIASAPSVTPGSPGDGINAEEQQLYNLITQYRAQNGLPAIPLSKALSIVANRHVLDLENNLDMLTHAWSDAPYNASDPSTYPSMWEAPQRLNTGYPGNGYENAFGSGGAYIATAAAAFNGWKNSPAHNQIILNQGVWQDLTWNALGIGIYGGFAVFWFGSETDPTGQPLVE